MGTRAYLLSKLERHSLRIEWNHLQVFCEDHHRQARLGALNLKLMRGIAACTTRLTIIALGKITSTTYIGQEHGGFEEYNAQTFSYLEWFGAVDIVTTPKNALSCLKGVFCTRPGSQFCSSVFHFSSPSLDKCFSQHPKALEIWIVEHIYAQIVTHRSGHQLSQF